MLERARDGTRTATNCVGMCWMIPKPQSDAVSRLRTSMNAITSSAFLPRPDLHKRSSLFGIVLTTRNKLHQQRSIIHSRKKSRRHLMPSHHATSTSTGGLTSLPFAFESRGGTEGSGMYLTGSLVFFLSLTPVKQPTFPSK